jgi:hypothetical protein
VSIASKWCSPGFCTLEAYSLCSTRSHIISVEVANCAASFPALLRMLISGLCRSRASRAALFACFNVRQCSGVFPTISLALISAPRVSRRSITSACPDSQARCNAVCSRSVRSSIAGCIVIPNSRQYPTIYACPFLAATCKIVSPFSVYVGDTSHVRKARRNFETLPYSANFQSSG